MVSRKTLLLGYHLHRETQYFHLQRETIFPLRENQRPCFRATPRSPKQPMKEGNPPTLFQLVASRPEVPFSCIVALPYSDPSWSTALLSAALIMLVCQHTVKSLVLRITCIALCYIFSAIRFFCLPVLLQICKSRLT